ncbi:hypothetical protein BKA63DRAFT_561876 [Paraphoma chrysanthemicola]|nr:hypothetical protein BKA63DRAFT_561876 [Paraphoma chrysanthemicola]
MSGLISQRPSRTGSLNRTKNADSSSRIFNRLGIRLRDLSDQQQTLIEFREKVVLNRQEIISSAQRVREERARIGEAEARLMDAFRMHSNEIRAPLPPNLTRAYDDVEEIRNKLVDLESSHVQIERHYGAMEWTLNDMENDLYQYDLEQLLSDEEFEYTTELPQEPPKPARSTSKSVLPSVGAQYQQAFRERCVLSTRLAALRKEHEQTLSIDGRGDWKCVVNDFDGSSIDPAFGDVIMQEVLCEIRIHRLKAILAPQGCMEALSMRASSESRDVTGYDARDTGTGPRAYSDSAIPHFLDCEYDDYDVCQWMLDSLLESRFEQFRFMASLKNFLNNGRPLEVEFEPWRECIALSWFDDIGLPQDKKSFEPKHEKQRNIEHLRHIGANDPLPERQSYVFDNYDTRLIQDLTFGAGHSEEICNGLPNQQPTLIPVLNIHITSAADISPPSTPPKDRLVNGEGGSPLRPALPQHRDTDTLEHPLNAGTDTTGLLGVHQHVAPSERSIRCDSAQNSDTGELGMRKKPSGILETQHNVDTVTPNTEDLIKQHSVVGSLSSWSEIAIEETDDYVVRYSQTQSSRLQLLLSLGLNDEDDVIEVIWKQHMVVPRKRSDEGVSHMVEQSTSSLDPQVTRFDKMYEAPGVQSRGITVEIDSISNSVSAENIQHRLSKQFNSNTSP